MTFLNAIHNAFPEQIADSDLTLSNQNSQNQTREEVIYRRNGKTVDRIIEIDVVTGLRVKTTHFDYFNDKKVRSIDEYDKVTGKKIRTINYVLYKSIDEYDLNSGEKIRTINFNIKDENKISSIQEYDLETRKIVKIYIFKRDGKTISIIKSIDPETEKVTNIINNKNDEFEYKIPELPKIQTKPTLTNIGTFSKKTEPVKPKLTPIFSKSSKKDDISRLIDNLYTNNINFESLED